MIPDILINKGDSRKLGLIDLQSLWEETGNVQDFFDMIVDKDQEISIHESKIKSMEPCKTTKYEAVLAFGDMLHNECVYKIRNNDHVKEYRETFDLLNKKNIVDKHAAKNTDIEMVCRMLGREPIRNKIYCPYHEEAAPSLHIYTKTNSFFCFSCHKGGDVIELVEGLKGYSFIDAVNLLNNL